MKIRELMKEKLENKQAALIPFIAAGYPDMETSERLIHEMDETGVEMMELGVPFSDPGADGPTIAAAYDVALSNGATLDGALALLNRVRDRGCEIGVILFSYYNPIFRMGLDEFALKAAGSGVDSVLVVDLPVEEAGELKAALVERGVGMVMLVSPTTSLERMKRIGSIEPDFIYYISRMGVTGVRGELSETLGQEIKALRRVVDRPIAVGFGISEAAHVHEVAKYAEGVVVGSSLVESLGAGGKDAFMEKVRELLGGLR